MANKTITQLDAAQSLNDNMVIAVQDTNTTYKTTLADVKAYCGGGEQVEATNNTGSAISEGDKVWINIDGGYILVSPQRKISSKTTHTMSISDFDMTTGIATNFSTSDYITIQDYPSLTVTSFEIQFKIKTPASSFESNHMVVLGQSSANYTTPQLELSSTNGYITIRVSEDASSWATIQDTESVAFDTWYWIKATWNGTTMRLYKSLDGVDYSEIGDGIACSAVVWNQYARIGRDNDNASVYPGSIDLSKSYIIMNGAFFWSAFDTLVPENTLTGIAAENIATGSTGLVNVASGALED